MSQSWTDVLYATVKPSSGPAGLPAVEDGGLDVARQRAKILVVDDERLITDTLAEILERAGFQVATAYDGWSAVEAAAQFQPDCLLSDVLMPRMNGVEVGIAVRKMCPAARIMLFTGQAGISEIVQDGRRQGYQFEVIAKPIQPAKLIQRLRAGL